AVQATEQLASWTGRIVRMCSLYSEAALVPRRRVVDPPSADHGRHHGDRGKLHRRAFEGVAVQDDQVGELAGNEPPAHSLGPFEPGRRQAGGVDGSPRDEPLLGMRGGPVVDSAENPRGNAGYGVELLDRRVRAVCD